MSRRLDIEEEKISELEAIKIDTIQNRTEEKIIIIKKKSASVSYRTTLCGLIGIYLEYLKQKGYQNYKPTNPRISTKAKHKKHKENDTKTYHK